ncbi:MAG TPA: hypothetical protein VGC34_18490 [Steroidobacteraceae bacterium]
MSESCTDLTQFIRGEVDPGKFPHREHVRMGFEILRRHNFEQAALHYCGALRAMTARIGKPMAFHQTITIAFLALIAERMETGEHSDFAAFAAANPDLIDKSALRRWYRPERLATEAARRTFLLPDPYLTGDRP